MLEWAPVRRIGQRAVGLGEVRSALIVPQYTRFPIAREIIQDVEQYRAELVTHSLLLTR